MESESLLAFEPFMCSVLRSVCPHVSRVFTVTEVKRIMSKAANVGGHQCSTLEYRDRAAKKIVRSKTTICCFYALPTGFRWCNLWRMMTQNGGDLITNSIFAFLIKRTFFIMFSYML